LQRSIRIRAARTHNLKDISLDLPHGRLTVVTGVSGSGKSSLVFDTLYAEGQRRYVQSLSTYARLFLERIDRPDVDSISEIPPALALRQKNTIKNARSTVGSITEINDYLRLLYAATGTTVCSRCKTVVRPDTIESSAAQVEQAPGLYLILASVALGSRAPREIAAYLAENGYHRVYLHDQQIATADLVYGTAGNGQSLESIEVVLDRLSVGPEGSGERIREALEKAFHLGGGRASALAVERIDGATVRGARLNFDRRFNCSRCGTAYPEPIAALFSSNSPLGACSGCEGFGRTAELDLEKVIPNPNLSLRQGLVAPWRTPAYREMHDWMMKCARRARVRTAAPLTEMSPEERTWLLDGEPGAERKWDERWPGVRGFFRWLERKRYKTHVRILLAKYRRFAPCSECQGTKLKPEALNVLLDGKTIAQAGQIPVRDLPPWFTKLAGDTAIAARGKVLLRELTNRASYLNEVGLGYLTLERQARTLSGGEAQRIHLASALGGLLSGTLYALDEPTVGLHAADSRRLLAVLRHLRDQGNTVVVVEHDPTMIAGGDHLVELGPGGGREGGNLIWSGVPGDQPHSNGTGAPGRALLMRVLARERRLGRKDARIKVIRASEHNLREVTVEIPLVRLVCLTGVSGSGKSTLMESVLYNNYLRARGAAVTDVGAVERIDGFDQISEMVHLGQELPARSMRSNPATYLKIYDDIRRLFASSPDARRLKVKPRDFSFNIEGGRCTKCQGSGTVVIEMHFMADLEVQCDACSGQRFQSHILAIRWQERNINEVLALTADEAVAFFAKRPTIVQRLEPLIAVGLGYLQLGQATSTLSGGEAQRLKLARFLLKDLEPPPVAVKGRPAGRLFLLDEPTTGLASADIRRLMRVLGRLVAEGNTVIAIEHNLEFIAQADYLIDLGPGGGDEGGRLLVAGDPLKVAACEKSSTGRELRLLFGLPKSGTRVTRSALRQAAAQP
jgi:excinuclease ABC subunit A